MEFDCNSRDDWKMDREDLITVRELCKILKVSKSWVRRQPPRGKQCRGEKSAASFKRCLAGKKGQGIKIQTWRSLSNKRGSPSMTLYGKKTVKF